MVIATFTFSKLKSDIPEMSYMKGISDLGCSLLKILTAESKRKINQKA